MTLRQYAALTTVLAWGCFVALMVEAFAPRRCDIKPACTCPAPATDRGGSDWAVEWAGVLP